MANGEWRQAAQTLRGVLSTNKENLLVNKKKYLHSSFFFLHNFYEPTFFLTHI